MTMIFFVTFASIIFLRKRFQSTPELDENGGVGRAHGQYLPMGFINFSKP
jgi:hypothetical protein